MLHPENRCLALIDCGDPRDVGDFLLTGANVEFLDSPTLAALSRDVCVPDTTYTSVFLGYRV